MPEPSRCLLVALLGGLLSLSTGGCDSSDGDGTSSLEAPWVGPTEASESTGMDGIGPGPYATPGDGGQSTSTPAGSPDSEGRADAEGGESPPSETTEDACIRWVEAYNEVCGGDFDPDECAVNYGGERDDPSLTVQIDCLTDHVWSEAHCSTEYYPEGC